MVVWLPSLCSNRKLFRASLQAPNENVVAQARWAATQKFIDLDPQLPSTVPKAFEARAWQAFYDSEWEAAVKAGKRWLRDQPFTANPAIHASYIAAIPLQDREHALRIVEQGLLANPNHPSLLNNKAYSLAQLGRIREAQDALKRANSKIEDAPTSIILRATEGLLAYRGGNPQQGNYLYQSAIQAALKEDTNPWRGKQPCFSHLRNYELLLKMQESSPNTHSTTAQTTRPATFASCDAE